MMTDALQAVIEPLIDVVRPPAVAKWSSLSDEHGPWYMEAQTAVCSSRLGRGSGR